MKFKERDISFAHYIKERLLSEDADSSIQSVYLTRVLENRETHDRGYELTIVRDSREDNPSARHEAEAYWAYERILRQVEREEGVVIRFDCTTYLGPANSQAVELYHRPTAVQRSDIDSKYLVRPATEDPIAGVDAGRYLQLAHQSLEAAQDEAISVISDKDHEFAVRYAKSATEHTLRSLLRFHGVPHYAGDTLESLVLRLSDRMPQFSTEPIVGLAGIASITRESAVQSVVAAERLLESALHEYSHHPQVMGDFLKNDPLEHRVDMHVWMRRSNDSMQAAEKLLRMPQEEGTSARVADSALGGLKRGLYGFLAASGSSFSVAHGFSMLLDKIQKLNPTLARTLNGLPRLDGFMDPVVLQSITTSHVNGLVDFSRSALGVIVKHLPTPIQLELPYVVRSEDQVFLEQEPNVVAQHLETRIDDLFALLEHGSTRVDVPPLSADQQHEEEHPKVEMPSEGRRRAPRPF